MFRQKLNALAAKRSISDPLPSGIAPYTTSTSSKTQTNDPKPNGLRWDDWFSNKCRKRGTSSLKASARTVQPSSMISLGTARPAPQYCPWDSIMIRGSNASTPKDENGTNPTVFMSCERGETAYDLDIALNYGGAVGSPRVLRFITEHVEMIHRPAYDDWETCLTCGTTSAIEIVLRMLCNSGDWVLAEAYTYSGAIEAAKALGLNILGVEMDDIGLLAEDLDSKLRDWDDARGPKPSVLYTIPSGQNPTGTTRSTQRRRDIYQVAEFHGLIIIEDDPYYLIQLNETESEEIKTKDAPTLPETYLENLPTSYLSLDSAGRVLRLDSTSKIIAPGLRLGWMTGCSQLVEKFLNYTEFSTVSPSGPSQVMLYKLLNETWGHEGLIHWLRHLSSQYDQRCKTLLEACERYLPREICHWEVPTVGMFLWIQLDWRKHPTLRSGQSSLPPGPATVTPLGIEDRVYTKARENGVLLSKGSWFAVDKDRSNDVYLRMTFAAAPHDTLARAVEIFASTLREEFMLVDGTGDESSGR